MKAKFNTVLIILLLINQYIIGQVDDEAPKIVPPSPTAFELGKYGQMNVSLFTGTPNIDIPLYVFKTKNLNVPITLNYASNGIKVDQMETNVGLGWNLNAGGVITRIVRDQKDEDNFTFYPENSISNLNDPLTLEYFYNAGQGNNDTETDIFMYNFNGYSGKFVFGNDKSIVKIPASPLIIQLLGEDMSDGFLIITPDGKKYFFKEPEYTTTRIEGGGTHSEPTDVLTSLYLSKIETPDSKEIINFEYTGIGYSYYAGWTQSFKIPFPDWQMDCENIAIRAVGTLTTTKTRISQSAKILTKIFSNNCIDGSVTFASEALLPGSTGYKMLSKITVLNFTNDTIEKFGFNYLQTANKRMFLSEVTTKDINKKYCFEYISLDQFPQRLSFSQDHWGYFNNKNNSYLIPKPENNDAFVGLTTYGDREPNPTAAMIGLLNKVTYPTRGYTELTYEGNSYYGTKTTFTDTNNQLNVQSTTNSEYEGGMNGIQTATLTIPFRQIVQIAVNVSYNTTGDCYNMDNPKPAGAFFTIKNNTSNNYADIYYKNSYGTNVVLDYSKFTTSNNNIAYYTLLDAGTYTVSVQPTFACMIGVANISYISNRVTNTVLTDIPEAGVRLKYLNTYDPTTIKTEIKRYYYTRHNALNQSTGVKIKVPQYVSNLQIHKLCQNPYAGQQSILDYKDIFYKILNSSSLVSVYNTSGINSTMYRYVTVSYGGDNFELGGEEHKFIINEDIDPYLMRGDYILNTPTTNTGWNNGLEEEVQIFKKGISNEHIILSKTNIHYITDNRNYKEVNGYSIRNNYYEPPFSINNLDIMSYKNISYWFYQDQKTTTMCDQYGLNPITTTEKFYYDNPEHMQLTRKEIVNSDNKSTKEKYYYPSDVNESNLLSQFRIAEVVKTESFVSDIKEKSKHILYNNWGNNIIAPHYIKTWFGENTPETDISFVDYDVINGNLQEIIGKDNTHIIYVWSYNGKYPVAEIKNTTKSEVESALMSVFSANSLSIFSALTSPNETKLKDGSLQTALPNALVTTYTYKPLIGISTITDPRGVTTYYEYDDFNRLKYIRDKDNKILQSFDYNYKQQ